ncbi:MAG: permease-like cell division protein FtsX, partial [Patescibacteria group bacterium]
GLAEVKDVEYISRENALNIFKERHADDATISQAVEELNSNPLLASLNVKARDPREYGIIASYLEDNSLKTSVDKVTFAQNQTVIERLVAIIETSNKVGVALAVFLASVAVLVTFNTIRLAIYSNRDEIGIMRLVGASNGFIRGPYIVEGVIYGVLSGVASLLIMVPIIKFASPYIGVFIPEVNLTAYLSDNFVKLLGYQLFFGIGLGIISSVIVIRRYLRV